MAPLTSRIAATVAACTAIACGGGSAHPAAPPAPIANQATGAAPAEAPAVDPRCGHAEDAEVPPLAAVAGPGIARGIVVDGLGHPIDGASVTVTGKAHTETQRGHSVTMIQGMSSTWTDGSGGFALGGLSRFMDELTVEYRGVKVTCPRLSDDTRAFKIEVQPAAV